MFQRDPGPWVSVGMARALGPIEGQEEVALFIAQFVLEAEPSDGLLALRTDRSLVHGAVSKC